MRFAVLWPVVPRATAQSLALFAGLLAVQWNECNRTFADDASRVRFKREVIDDRPPRNPWFKMIGDVDQDGDLDILVAGSKGPLVWYANPTWRKSQLANGNWDGVNAEAVDLDRDGDTDIVMGGTIWIENPGITKGSSGHGSTTGPWTTHPIIDRQAHDIEVADLDGDGLLDVVGRDQSAFGRTGNQLDICFQRAGKQWKRLTLECPHGEGLKLGDLDSDGDHDIILPGVWYENPGDDRSRWRSWEYAPDWGEPDGKVELADLNQDGRQDIVLTPAELKGETYRVSWFETPTDATSKGWTEHVVIPSIECVIHSLGVGDFDGDGAIDLAMAEMHQGRDPDEVMVLYNDDRGRSWQKQVISNSGSHDIVVSDIDGDGDPDIVGANHSGNHPVELWRNERLR